MSILKIRWYGDPILREETQEIKTVDDQIKTLVDDMFDTMYSAPGIGLAAPQVGKSLRLFILDIENPNEGFAKPYVFINPVVTDSSGSYTYQEGCLSFPGIYANVIRPNKITVSAIDKEGNTFELKNIDGLLARCILHELDHLNGVLFIDKVSMTDKMLIFSRIKKLRKKSKIVS